MGVSLSRRRSKSRRRHATGKALGFNDNYNEVFSNDLHFVEKLVPERYLVLLIEQMTEVLFRLMTSDDTSIGTAEIESDRSPSQSQSAQQSCTKCQMKTLMIEEYIDEIKSAFDQADVQKNGHLRANELKNAIGYLNLHFPDGGIIEIINDCVKNEPTNSIDLVLFTNIVKALQHREPITLEKFKSIRRGIKL